MKALSLWQPWATLIALGLKVYETRHWSTAYRGPLAIHAAQLVIRDVEPLLDRLLVERLGRDWGRAIPRGAFVAHGVLVDCVETGKTRGGIGDVENLCGDWEPGRWAWKLEHVTALAEPVYWRGRQGLFDVPRETFSLPSEPARS